MVQDARVEGRAHQHDTTAQRARGTATTRLTFLLSLAVPRSDCRCACAPPLTLLLLLLLLCLLLLHLALELAQRAAGSLVVGHTTTGSLPRRALFAVVDCPPEALSEVVG